MSKAAIATLAAFVLLLFALVPGLLSMSGDTSQRVIGIVLFVVGGAVAFAGRLFAGIGPHEPSFMSAQRANQLKPTTLYLVGAGLALIGLAKGLLGV